MWRNEKKIGVEMKEDKLRAAQIRGEEKILYLRQVKMGEPNSSTWTSFKCSSKLACYSSPHCVTPCHQMHTLQY